MGLTAPPPFLPLPSPIGISGVTCWKSQDLKRKQQREIQCLWHENYRQRFPAEASEEPGLCPGRSARPRECGLLSRPVKWYQFTPLSIVSSLTLNLRSETMVSKLGKGRVGSKRLRKRRIVFYKKGDIFLKFETCPNFWFHMELNV